ncbi:hypothetical protein BDZ94DRAFT_788146 [Collybia nuda]|uniref:Uncharacterized protein n=1 Tax=Collybia nuda TaxID=64659 RepID=A0A9P5Y5T4_9AGAR|nr:hypothetical protein BDZ94DRAFT_788146 [Collybia nuda]
MKFTAVALSTVAVMALGVAAQASDKFHNRRPRPWWKQHQHHHPGWNQHNRPRFQRHHQRNWCPRPGKLERSLRHRRRVGRNCCCWRICRSFGGSSLRWRISGVLGVSLDVSRLDSSTIIASDMEIYTPHPKNPSLWAYDRGLIGLYLRIVTHISETSISIIYVFRVHHLDLIKFIFLAYLDIITDLEGRIELAIFCGDIDR